MGPTPALQWGRDLTVADRACALAALDSTLRRPNANGGEERVGFRCFIGILLTVGALPMGARDPTGVLTPLRCSRPYRVTKTGYSPNSPCRVLANSRACISSSLR